MLLIDLRKIWIYMISRIRPSDQLFYSTFSDLGVTRSAQNETFWPHFLAHISTDQVDIWYSVAVTQAKHLEANLEWINETMGTAALSLTAANIFNIRMYSDVSESNRFSFGMKIYTIKVNIWV